MFNSIFEFEVKGHHWNIPFYNRQVSFNICSHINCILIVFAQKFRFPTKNVQRAVDQIRILSIADVFRNRVNTNFPEF